MVRVEIDQQVAQTDEAAALVPGARAAVRRVRPRVGASKNLLAAETGPLPTADELGAELERFLAEQTRPGRQPG